MAVIDLPELNVREWLVFSRLVRQAVTGGGWSQSEIERALGAVRSVFLAVYTTQNFKTDYSNTDELVCDLNVNISGIVTPLLIELTRCHLELAALGKGTTR